MSRGRSGTIIEQPAFPTPGKAAPRGDGGERYKKWVPKLEKLSRGDVTLLSRLEWLVPRILLTGDFSGTVAERLQKLFDEEARLWVDYVHLADPKDLRKLVSEPTFLGVVTPSPHGPRGVIELELTFAHAMVDQLLGASGEVATRPLTEIEEGVLQYVVLETFRAISPTPEPGRPRLRLERVARGLDDALEVFEGEKTVAVIELKALIGVSAGYVRLVLPGSMVTKAAPPEVGPGLTQRRLALLTRHFDWLEGVRAWLRAEIGGTELTVGDLKGLSAGDVLLIDNLLVNAMHGEEGKAVLRVGLGKKGKCEAAVAVADGRYQATIESLVLGQDVPNAPPDDEAAEALSKKSGDVAPPERGDEDADEDEWDKVEAESDPTNPGENPWENEKTSVSPKPDIKEDAAELLNDVPLHVAVELARVPVTADEVVGLHVGKVIDLGTAPGDPVNLSVNGKVVARGELVEIDGQLGVRILTLAE